MKEQSQLSCGISIPKLYLNSINQHNFIFRQSTATNLISGRNISDSSDKHLQVNKNLIYIDFSKAVDPINHDLLFDNLNNFRFLDNVINKIVTFLLKDCQFI